MLAAAAPAVAAAQQDTYTDVADGVHKPAIDALAERGLFEGTLCDQDRFCPGEPLKRSTMAVWLIRAVQDQDPPPVSEPRFADVAADEWWAPHAERLAELEITAGDLHSCAIATDNTITCWGLVSPEGVRWVRGDG